MADAADLDDRLFGRAPSIILKKLPAQCEAVRVLDELLEERREGR